jgi:NAD(P)H-dependent flavin oxidoreductase YrpB (nitropropane dioxygenase family)
MRTPPLPAPLRGLALPVIAAPLFIISTPRFVIEQCMAGVIGPIGRTSRRNHPTGPPPRRASTLIAAVKSP